MRRLRAFFRDAVDGMYHFSDLSATYICFVRAGMYPKYPAMIPFNRLYNGYYELDVALLECQFGRSSGLVELKRKRFLDAPAYADILLSSLYDVSPEDGSDRPHP